MIHLIFISVILIAFLGRKNNLCYKISFLILAIVSCLRYMYGSDYYSYYLEYKHIQNGYNSPFENEWLFTFFNKIAPSFYVLIVATSLFFIWVIYRLLCDNLQEQQIWIGISVFLISPYLYLMNLSAIRQCMAMCFFIISIRAIEERNIKKYIFLIIVAALFHKSAIVLLPVYFVVNDKKVKNIDIVGIILLIVFLLSFSGLYDAVEKVAVLFNDSNYMAYLAKEEGNTIRATLLSSVYCIYILFNLPRMEGKNIIYGKLYLFSTIFVLLAYKMSTLSRIQMYFDIFSVVVIPYLLNISNINGKVKIYHQNILKTVWEFVNRYILPILILVIYLLRYYSFFTNPMWQSFVKYRTILDLL